MKAMKKIGSILPSSIDDLMTRVINPVFDSEECKRRNPDSHNESNGELSICNSEPGTASKIHRKRKRLTNIQLSELKSAFEKGYYIDKSERKYLAQRTNLTETQVKTWFGNRRQMLRRQQNSGTTSRSTASVQHQLNDSPTCSVMNQSMSEFSSYSSQSHQMYDFYQYHIPTPHGHKIMPQHQIINSTTAYPNHSSMASWNPTSPIDLTNSLPPSITSEFHRLFKHQDSPPDYPPEYPPTPNTITSLPLPMFSEFHQSFDREESSPNCPPTPNTMRSLPSPMFSEFHQSFDREGSSPDSVLPSDTIETTGPSHIANINNNLLSPWSYTSNQPLQPISFPDIQSFGNQMQYITPGLSMHHYYPPSFIQQNPPTFSTHSEAKNIPQQYSYRY